MTDTEPDNMDDILKWIKQFRRVMKKCPRNVWFYSNGELHIMVKDKNRNVHMTKMGGVDPDYVIDTDSSALWEGGDW